LEASKASNIDTDRYVGFEVLTAASMNMAVFWVVAPCSLVNVYRLNGATTQKTTIFLYPVLQLGIEASIYTIIWAGENTSI
jgi:hypothetical protein